MYVVIDTTILFKLTHDKYTYKINYNSPSSRYIVLNRETQAVVSGWSSKEEAKRAAKDLNKLTERLCLR